MHRKGGQTTDYIYENDDVIKGHFGKETTDSTQGKSSELTGSDSVRNRSSRAAAMCLVLLCVLLLTAVIVLCVHIHTKSTNYTEERDQLLTNITNLIEERDQLLTNITNLIEERDQLLTNITNLIEERDQLLTNITNLAEERDQLLTNNTRLREEKDQLSIKNKNLTNERDQLRNELIILGGWTYYKSRFYYMSNETKNWTESRRYCTERGADLIIINNREEQDFVKNMTGSAAVWIGLTDSVVENTWKWVNGSTLTSGFWGTSSGFPKEPNGDTRENCALTADHNQRWSTLSGWSDFTCNSAFQWICEKSISQLTLP